MQPRVLVLGTAQDGGMPHAGCACGACAAAHADPSLVRRVASIAVVGASGRVLLVDATPDLIPQLAALGEALGGGVRVPDAILVTHAHIGHYLGLAFLGREALGAGGIPLWCSDRMARFLGGNRPWSRLLAQGHVQIHRLVAGEARGFDGLRIDPFLSPHRAEDTDTLGIEVEGPSRRLLYLPDADRLTPELVERIAAADIALVDGTFHDPRELPHRDLREIPHPFVAESVRELAHVRGEVWFTHLNHTNPLLDPDPSRRPTLPEGFAVLGEGASFGL